MTIRFNPSDDWPQFGRAFNHGVVKPGGWRVHITGLVAPRLLVERGPISVIPHQRFIAPSADGKDQ